MKEVILITDIFGCGGIEKFIFNVCQHIDHEHFHVSVLSIVADDSSYYLREFDKAGVPFKKLLDHKETNPLKRNKAGHKAFREYLKKIDKKTILHFNISNSIDMKYAIIAKKCGFENLIYHSHNSDATSSLKRIAHKIFKPIRCQCAKYNIACSKKAAVWLFGRKDIENNNYIIINNAIDARQYEYQLKVRELKRNELGIGKDLLVGHVGRYNVQKNHMFLIQIFNEILKSVPDAKLLLIGEGDLQEQAISQIKQLGISEHVICINQTNEVSSYLQAMDVFLLPSLYEGLPFVLVESQAASLPTVASDTITREIKITDYLEYVSLEAGLSVWAEKTIQAAETKRESTYEQIRTSGFDIFESIHRLESVYDSMSY